MTARIDTSPCPVPVWLPGGHAQTLYGAFCAQHPTLHFVRERVDTPDGDFIDLDWCGPGLNPNQRADGLASPHEPGLVGTAARRWIEDADWAVLAGDAPALILFHGLEGSSLSPYMQAIAHDFRAAGWVVVAVHFRGCSGVPNRMARAYYSGDSAEIDFIISHVRARLPGAGLHAAGVSLGGNALLKLLGEAGGAPHGLRAAAGLSVPMDLAACGRRLSDTAWGRQMYSRYFLHSIRRKIFDKARDLGAWLGIVPRQYSTGGKPKLLGISKRGNKYLRTLLIHGARAALPSLARSQTPLGAWLRGLLVRRHRNTVVVALANKLARIAWVTLRRGVTFEASLAAAPAS